MNDTPTDRDFEIARLIKTIKHHAKQNCRLPFGPTDPYFESTPRELMMENVADLLERDIKKRIGNDNTDNTDNITEIGLLNSRLAHIQEENKRLTNIVQAFQDQNSSLLITLGSTTDSNINEIVSERMEQLTDYNTFMSDVAFMLISLNDALVDGDDDGRPVDWIAALLRECDSMNIDDENAFKSVNKIKEALNSVFNALSKIESSPMVAYLRLNQPTDLPRIIQK